MNSELRLMVSRMLVACAGLITLAGCGGAETELPRAAVSGQVSLGGKPLEEGVVRFIPKDGTPGPKTSVSIAGGEFRADEEAGPVVGTHRVEIDSTDDGGYAMDDETAIKRLKESGVRRIEVVRVPAIYNSRSTLTATISADAPNELTFELKAPEKP